VSTVKATKNKASSIDDLILKIHGLPLEPGGWGSVIQSLQDLCNADKGILLRVGSAPAMKPWVLPVNFNAGVLDDYADNWASQDLLYLGAVNRGRVVPGLVSTEQQLVDRREYLSSAYFNEYLKPNDIEPHLNVCLTTAMPQLGFGASAITLYRGVGKESFGEEERSLLQRVAPHLALAARTTWHLESLSLAEPIYRRTLDEIRVPLFVLDMRGRISLINKAGEDLLARKIWITASTGTLIASNELHCPDDFRNSLAKLTRGVSSTLLLTDGASRQQAVMTTAPIGVESRLQVAKVSIAGIIWIVPVTPLPSPVKSFGMLFQLTPAEIRLLQLLVDGIHLSDAAAQLGIALNTIRTQLKAIFRKTGQRTQGQLLALASRMAMIRTGE
jgi:DNA-binding CsgD family transcriptional regulator